MTNSLQTEIQKRKNAEKKIKRRFRCKKNRDNVIDFICPEKKITGRTPQKQFFYHSQL